VQSFQCWLADLATLVKNRHRSKAAGGLEFDITTTPTTPQQRAFDLLGIAIRV
jgi:hypothetical protein